MLKHGTIKELQGSGGIVLLLIEDEKGEIDTVYAENPTAFRAFNDAFGCIVDGCTIDAGMIIGQEIEYATEGGILVGFNPL